MSNLAASKTYTKTTPSATYPDTGGVELTDGNLGTSLYTSGHWVGWQTTNPEIVIDLATAQYIGYVRFHYLLDSANVVHSPKSCIISGSNDGTNFTTLGEFYQTTDWVQSAGASAQWSNNLYCYGSYRYIKFAFTYQTSWLFLSELQIYPYTDAYVTPVIDRVLSDVTTPTAKGRFNVSDWNRIYIDAKIINARAVTKTGNAITFDEISQPTRATIPTVANLNTLLSNIERVRAALGALSIPQIYPSWRDGKVPSPTWQNFNAWELAISQLYALSA